jgi:hypothetical protein
MFLLSLSLCKLVTCPPTSLSLFSASCCRANALPDMHTHTHTHAHARTHTAAGLSLELFSPQHHLPAAAAHHQTGAQRNEFKMAAEDKELLVESPGW